MNGNTHMYSNIYRLVFTGEPLSWRRSASVASQGNLLQSESSPGRRRGHSVASVAHADTVRLLAVFAHSRTQSMASLSGENVPSYVRKM